MRVRALGENAMAVYRTDTNMIFRDYLRVIISYMSVQLFGEIKLTKFCDINSGLIEL